jgi:hypothetical protein
MKVVETFEDYAGDEIGFVTFQPTNLAAPYILPTLVEWAGFPVAIDSINIYAPRDVIILPNVSDVIVPTGVTVHRDPDNTNRIQSIQVRSAPGARFGVYPSNVIYGEELCIKIIAYSPHDIIRVYKDDLIATLYITNYLLD